MTFVKELKFIVLTIDDVVQNDDRLSVFKLAFRPFTRKKLEKVVQEYRDDAYAKILCCFKRNELLGIIGYTTVHQNNLLIKQIVIVKRHQLKGFGRLMINELITNDRPKKIEAQTDNDAVGFYRKLGFFCKPIDSECDNRYRCIFKNDP